MIPPVWVIVQMGWFWFPFPVVLLWPILALVWIILGLCLSVVLLGTGGNAANAGKIWIECWRFLCALRGIRLEVEQVPVNFKVSVI